MTRLPPPDAPHVLAVVQAGGRGSRMDVLTRERAKPALPYAGSHRLVDLAISLAASAGISDVWVTVQYMASTLDDHLQHGRPWDLDRVRGGYRRMVPESGRGDVPAFSDSNTEDLLAIRDSIEELSPDVVVTMSADQVLACDLAGAVTEHVASGAECTVLTLPASAEVARTKAVVTAEGDTVVGIEEKPEEPDEESLVSAEVIIHSWPALRDVLDAARADRASSPGDGATDEPLGDLPEELLPRLIDRGRTRQRQVEGYWRDMGRPSAYLQGHRDLTRRPEVVFEAEHLVIRSSHPDLPPALVTSTASVADSLLTAGCRVSGDVHGSVLGPGVVVEEGAVVLDSVLFEGVHVAAGARVSSAVLDEDVRVGPGATVGAPAPSDLTDEDVAPVGRHSVIGEGVGLDAGARLEPGTTV
ncbi:sugar phosphate nucleotidyltransferase [Kytococcus sp. Marseille-QA3725]